MKKCLISIILMLLVCTGFSKPHEVLGADSGEISLSLGTQITDWVLGDELYVISGSRNELYFINSETNTIEETIVLGARPTDLALKGDKLYVALYTSQQIAVIDIHTRTLVKSISTTGVPYSIVPYQDSIIYAEYDQWCNVFRVDTNTGVNTKLKCGKFCEPSIAVNEDAGILYIGESGSSGADLYYYDLNTDQYSITNREYGFSFPERKIVYYGNYVYYAGKQFDPFDVTKIEGEFSDAGSIFGVKGDLAYFSNGVYSTKTCLAEAEYTIKADKIVLGYTSVFTYDNKAQTITRYNSERQIREPRKELKIEGQGQSLEHGIQMLEMPSYLSNWVYDEGSKNIFAIASDEKSLVCISSETLDCKKVIPLKSVPSEMELKGNTLYLVFKDLKKVVAIDIATLMVKDTYYTSEEPATVAISNNKIYFTYNTSGLYEYDMGTRVQTKLTEDCYTVPHITLNEEDQLIYIGESRTTLANLFYYSISEKKVISTSSTFPNESQYTEIFFDGSKVYYAGSAFDKQDATKKLGTFSEEPDDDMMYLVKNGRVYMDSGIYDANTYEWLSIYDEYYLADLIEEDANGKYYVYSETLGAILYSDPLQIHCILFDANGGKGSVYEFVVDGDKSVEVTEPTRDRYIFAGWYEDKECTKPWDFTGTVIKKEYILYAKWLPIPNKPYYIYAYSNETNVERSIMVSWVDVSGADGYELYQGVGKGDVAFQLVQSSSESSSVCENLTLGQTYQYKARAYKLVNNQKVYGAFSDIFSYHLVDNQVKTVQVKRASETSITVNWNSVNNAVGYRVYVDPTGDGEYSQCADVKQTTHTINNLYVGYNYRIKVVAFFLHMFGEFDGKSSAVVSMKLPFSKVTKLTATSGHNWVNLKWKAINGASTYEVYRSTSKEGKYKKIGDYNTVFREGSLTIGTTYYYKIRPCSNANMGKVVYGDFSDPISVTPSLSKTNDLKILRSSYKSIYLSWDVVEAASGYDIYRSTSKTGGFSKIGTGVRSSWVDKSVKTGTTYYYKVRAYHVKNGKKIYGGYSHILTFKLKLATPKISKVIKSSSTSAKVSWSSISGASGYEVYQATSKTGAYKKVATTKANVKSYQLKNFKKGKTYYIKVRAFRMVDGKKVYSSYSAIVAYKAK